MSRPMYESQSDVTRENKMKALLETKWNCELNKLPIKYHLDWMAMRGKDPMAFVEFKHRENLSIYKYPRYMISLDKWMKAKQLCKEVEIPFIMVITFTEGNYYGVFSHNGIHDMAYGFGGRYDRGDAQDVEPMIYLPLKKFQKIEGPRL
jgi:hypothetical protein